MEEHDPEIELYVSVGNNEQNTAIQQAVASLALDRVVKRTLYTAGITQPVMLTILITDDDTLQDMNKQYRQQNKPTDVLSFPLLDAPLVNAPRDQLWIPSAAVEGEAQTNREKASVFVAPPGHITNLGDIAISWPTLLRQATENGHSFTYELFYLVSHGVLHLVGYDDQHEAGYQVMVQIQESVLQFLGQKT